MLFAAVKWRPLAMAKSRRKRTLKTTTPLAVGSAISFLRELLRRF